MKRKSILVSLQVVLLLGAVVGCDTAPKIEATEPEIEVSAPMIEAKEDAYDFGVAVEGDVVSHAFEIANRGDETLIIARLSTSCGCTVTTLVDRELEPGDVRRIEVEVDTSGFGGTTISKKVTVESNDPEQPQIFLTIVGKVVPEAANLMDVADLAASLMFLVDVRARPFYAAGHLVGAVNLTLADADIWTQVLPKDVPVVLYDQDGETVPQISDQMLQAGFMNLKILMGGLDEWTRRYGDRMITTFPLIVGVLQME